MTIERAVEILNERKHRDFSKWYVYHVVPGTTRATPQDCHDPYNMLDEFEAIAIAEKYEREASKK